MKIKNIALGDFVQVKKSLCHSEFKAKQVCEVIDIDPTDKCGFDVLIQGKNCLDWVNHKDLKKPEPQLKQLNQSVFNNMHERWKFAAVDDDGRAYYFMKKPVIDQDDPCFIDGSTTRCKWIGEGYDASNWQNSLIERDIAKELLEVDLSSELTGSDYYYSKSVTERLENGQELVMCFVSNVSESDAMQERHVEVITSVDTEFNDSDGYGWQYAIPINNQGEPLTAAEAGL